MDITYRDWTVEREIGSGSFGTVYEIERESFGFCQKAALKVISIPRSQSELASLINTGMDEASIGEYYKDLVANLTNELKTMEQLKGHSNIVSYEDHEIRQQEKGIGWDIFIRMELLTPLPQYLTEHRMSQKEIVRIGIDLCRALERCEAANIIHRDIKPDNIFMTRQNDAKLGDFGIARSVEQTISEMSKKGTYNFMAPEIYLSQPYGKTVDIYSLGLVLYRLLNHNRDPFVPAFPKAIKMQDQLQAIMKRISGEPLPAPAEADPRLSEIVLKACSHRPEDRFQTAQEMRIALEGIEPNSRDHNASTKDEENIPITSEQPDTEDEEFDDETVAVFSTNGKEGEKPSDREADSTGNTVYFDHAPQKKTSNRRSLVAVIAAVLSVALIAGLVIVMTQPKQNVGELEQGEAGAETVEMWVDDLASYYFVVGQKTKVSIDSKGSVDRYLGIDLDPMYKSVFDIEWGNYESVGPEHVRNYLYVTAKKPVDSCYFYVFAYEENTDTVLNRLNIPVHVTGNLEEERNAVITVPKLTGESYSYAYWYLYSIGLTPEIDFSQYQVDKTSIVVEQQPQPGISVKKGNKVNVTIGGFSHDDAEIMSDQSKVEMSVGQGTKIVISASGNLPDEFLFSVADAGLVEAEWGEWISEGTCELFITASAPFEHDLLLITLDETEGNNAWAGVAVEVSAS